MKSTALEVSVGPLTVKFYPLTLVQMQELEDALAVLRGADRKPDEAYFSSRRISKMLPIYVASARSRDPSISEDDVKRVVDIENVASINAAVLGRTRDLVSDLKSGDETPTGPQTGGESTLG